jgi:HemY protein
VTLLLAAGAGRLGGREAEAEAAYQALTARPDAAFLGLRGLLRQAMDRGDLDAAAELARRAEAAQPGTAWLREERLHLALRTGDWTGALRLAPPDRAEPRAALTAAVAARTGDPKEAARLAKSAWEADPKLVPAALAYARRLRGSARESAAQDVLRRTWSVAPHPDVAALSIEPVGNRLERYRAGQRFVQSAVDMPDSRLLLARLALDAGLLGEAHRHLDAAAGSGLRQRRLAVLRADLAEAENDPVAAREALRDAAVAEPDPAWRCTACATEQPEWTPVCTACGTAGGVSWSAATPDGAVAQRQLLRLPEAQHGEVLP